MDQNPLLFLKNRRTLLFSFGVYLFFRREREIREIKNKERDRHKKKKRVLFFQNRSIFHFYNLQFALKIVEMLVTCVEKCRINFSTQWLPLFNFLFVLILFIISNIFLKFVYLFLFIHINNYLHFNYCQNQIFFFLFYPYSFSWSLLLDSPKWKSNLF